MVEKLVEQLKLGNYELPAELLLNYKKMKITEQELIVIIYMLNNSGTFNPKKISENLKLSMPEVMQIIDSLMTKDIISIEVVKMNNISDEVINLDNIYKKIAYNIVNKEEINTTTIYDKFEKEFKRTLSPIEYELIAAWIDAGSTEEIIELALKEAVYNGAFNLKYIDKIIYEWNKKGIKCKDDVIKDKDSFNSKKETKKELFDYDWLNDSDE